MYSNCGIKIFVSILAMWPLLIINFSKSKQRRAHLNISEVFKQFISLVPDNQSGRKPAQSSGFDPHHNISSRKSIGQIVSWLIVWHSTFDFNFYSRCCAVYFDQFTFGISQCQCESEEVLAHVRGIFYYPSGTSINNSIKKRKLALEWTKSDMFCYKQ